MNSKIMFAAALIAFAAPASAMSYITPSTAAAVACDVSAAANAALSVEDAVNQGKASQVVRTGATATVQAASADVCAQLGGVAKASAPASAN